MPGGAIEMLEMDASPFSNIDELDALSRRA
jgi:hypothetical protein